MNSREGLWGPHRLSYVVHTMAMHPAASTNGAATTSILACSSFLPETSNFVELLSIPNADPEVVSSVGRLPHYYPASRVRWMSADLLATSGDYIRIWDTQGQLRRLLRHDANPKGVCAPITSVDAVTGGRLASCDVYGVCSLWDAEVGTKTGAINLEQPLCDVAFGPDGILAVAGERGDVFVMDPRQPENVHVLPLRNRVCGPARIAWSPSSSGMLAVAWQGEQGGLAVYNGLQKSPGRLLQSASRRCGAIADLQWSHDFAEYLCCASEGGGVEVWQVDNDTSRGGPCFCWQPRAGEVCTSLALSSHAQQQQVMLATMPAQATQGSSTAGSLWVAGLPNFSEASGQSPASTSGEASSLEVAPLSAVAAA